MGTFLGYEIETPVEYRNYRDELLSTTRGGAQFAFGTGNQRFGISFEITDVDGSLGATLSAHRARHKFTTAFNFDFPQHLGVTTTTRTVRAAEAGAVNANQIDVDATGAFTIAVGTFFQFTGHAKLHQCVDYASATTTTGTLTFEPSLEAAVADNAVLDLSPTARMVHDISQPERYRYANQIVLGALVNLVEYR